MYGPGEGVKEPVSADKESDSDADGPPPGFEMYGPCEGVKEPVSADKESDSDADGSDCSTADTSEVPVPSDYQPGQVMKMMAAECLSPNARKPRLDLDKALPEENQGSPECPSIGSAGHHLGICKPCDFMYRTDCRAGFSCQFCHLCPPGETRRRKKQKQAARRAFVSATQAQAAAQAAHAATALQLWQAQAVINSSATQMQYLFSAMA